MLGVMLGRQVNPRWAIMGEVGGERAGAVKCRFRPLSLFQDEESLESVDEYTLFSYGFLSVDGQVS
jgi:hypothetical protein